jgi:imidazolonepropionase-like amidohydrolase
MIMHISQKKCIYDVRLLDGLGGDIPSADVFIQESILTDVRSPSGPLPTDWEIIPGHRRTLMPGLIDGHVHLLFDSSSRAPLAMLGKNREQLIAEAIPRARQTLASGVTSIRELAGTASPIFSIKESLAGMDRLPRIFDCVTTLTAEGGFASNIVPTVTKENASRVINQYAEKADLIKVLGDQYDPNSPDGFAAHFDDDTFAEICRVAQHVGKPLTVHAKCLKSIQQAIEYGAHSIEHGVRAEEVELKGMAERGIFLDATFLGLKSRADNQPDFDEFDRVKAFYARALKLGVPLTLGSDAGAIFTPHAGVVQELQFMVEAGLLPHDAIKAATSVNARRLNDNTLGVVAVGRRADLLLIGEDPLKDISAIGNHLVWVMKDGEIVCQTTK